MGGCLTHAEKYQHGALSSTKIQFNFSSQVLTSSIPEYMKILDQLLLSAINKKLKDNILLTLIFKASDFNFSAQQFHNKCEEKQNILLLALTTQDKILGGYSPCKWKNKQKYHYQEDKILRSFLFKITNNSIVKYKLKKQQSLYAILSHHQLGPVFGKGHDLHIADRAHENNCWASLGKTYQCNYKYGSVKGNSQMAEAMNFKLKEYEIWQINET